MTGDETSVGGVAPPLYSFASISAPGEEATTQLPPPTTLENERVCSFSRAQRKYQQWPLSKTRVVHFLAGFVYHHHMLENEHMRLFSRHMQPSTLTTSHLLPPSKLSTCAHFRGWLLFDTSHLPPPSKLSRLHLCHLPPRKCIDLVVFEGIWLF